MDAVIALMRRMDRKVAAGATYREGEQPFETFWKGDGEGDPWHVPVTIVSTYASMDDIKGYVVREKDPGLSGKDWSMCRVPGGGATLSWDGKKLSLSRAEIDALARDHESGYFAVDVVRQWGFGCDRDEWPEEFGHGATRLDARAIGLVRRRLERKLRELDADGLADRMDDAEYSAAPCGRLLSMCMAGAAMARKRRLAAFIYSV